MTRGLWIGSTTLVLAVKALLNKTSAVLEEIRTKLTAGAGQCMESVEIDALRQLGHDAVSSRRC